MLSEAKARAAKAQDKRYRLHDADGLMLEVRPNGKKSWVLRYTEAGKRKDKVLGAYPALSLREGGSWRRMLCCKFSVASSRSLRMQVQFMRCSLLACTIQKRAYMLELLSNDVSGIAFSHLDSFSSQKDFEQALSATPAPYDDNVRQTTVFAPARQSRGAHKGAVRPSC